MLEQFYTQTSVITQFRRGVLGPYLDDLATTLHAQGYAQASIRCSLRYCHQFGQWLAAQGCTVAEVDETLVEQYLNGFPRTRDGRRPRVAQGLPHLIWLLRQQDIIPPPNHRPFTTAIDQWLRQYEQYLEQVLGAAASTRKSYLLIARRLLRAYFGTAPLDWQVLQAQTLSDFVQQEAATRIGGGRKLVTAGVRAVLRFLVFCGERSPGLEAAAPPQRQWTHAPLPRRLTTEEVEQVLAAYDDTTPQHLRDRAIVILLARLGLRAHEIVTLHFTDLDWHEGWLRIRAGKAHRERRLPLTQEVGMALARYLRHGRPVSLHRQVFLQLRAPFRPFTNACSVSDLARRAMVHAGLTPTPGMGAHTFRRTAASQMINRGASFKDVADVLGHQSLETTALYAKLNVEALALVALPWPGGVS
jgi:site-specific recombinase XerD